MTKPDRTNPASTNVAPAQSPNFKPRRRRSLNVVEAAVANSARWMVRFLILAMISFGFWAAATELPELAYAEGVIVPSGPLNRVEHLDGGVVAKIRATEGQFVAKGETLVMLSAQAVDVDARRLRLRASTLKRTVSRLQTVFDRVDGYYAASGIGNGIDQDKHLHAQLETYETTYARLVSRLADIERSIVIRQSLHTNAVEREAAYGGELAAMRSLWKQQLITRSEYSAVEARRLDITAQRLRASVSLTDAERERSEIEHSMVEYVAGVRENLLSELEVAEAERDFTLQAIADNEERRARLAISSPITGVVQRIHISSLGEVVDAGGLIAEILPTEEILIAEINLRPGDIGHVNVGDKVELKSTTFAAKKFGVLSGEVQQIAPNSQKNDIGEVFFPVKIALAEQQIGTGERVHRLSPGMEVNAAILTDSRSVLDYVLEPILGPVRRAFYER